MANIWSGKTTLGYLREEPDGTGRAFVGKLADVTLTVCREPSRDGPDPAYRLRAMADTRERAAAIRDAMFRATGKEPPTRKPPSTVNLAWLYWKRSGSGRGYMAGRLNGCRLVMLDDTGGQWRLLLQPADAAATERARSALDTFTGRAVVSPVSEAVSND